MKVYFDDNVLMILNIGDILGDRFLILKIDNKKELVGYFDLYSAKEYQIFSKVFYELVYLKYSKHTCKDIVNIDYVRDRHF